MASWLWVGDHFAKVNEKLLAHGHVVTDEDEPQTADEKRLQQLIEFIKRPRTVEEHVEDLKRAGILDESGKLSKLYRT